VHTIDTEKQDVCNGMLLTIGLSLRSCGLRFSNLRPREGCQQTDAKYQE